MLSRREFVDLGFAATAWWLAGPMIQAPPIAQASIPSTGEKIARIGLGTYRSFDVGTDPAARAPHLETLKVFAAGGGQLVDSSPMYGPAEGVVGDLVAQAGLRDRLFIATKVWTTGREAGIEQMNASAAKLKTPKIDLMQIHNLMDWQTHLATLREWKEQGKIRYLGITHFQAGAIDAVADIVRREQLDFVQMNLSLDEPQAASMLLGLCADRGVAFIANRPFGAGQSLDRVRGKALPPWAAEFGIQSWAQLLLKWVLSYPEVTCAIPATRNPRHMEDNLGAARGAMLDQAARDRITRLWRES